MSFSSHGPARYAELCITQCVPGTLQGAVQVKTAQSQQHETMLKGPPGAAGGMHGVASSFSRRAGKQRHSMPELWWSA